MTQPAPKKTYTQYAAWTLGLLVVLFLALQLIFDYALRSMRLDLTENNLYTLSEGTEQVLQNLDRPITLRLYYSDKASTGMAQLKAYAGRVEDLLREYVAVSDGNVELEILDPEPFSEEEDEAVAYGLRGAATGQGDAVYFGLVATDDLDGQAVIPFISQDREPTLEYDITKLIYEMTRDSKPRLALVTSLPMQFGPGGIMAAQQGQAQPYVIYEQLNQLFDVNSIGQDFDRIPEDTDVLMLAHATDLETEELYAIDQYVLKGGKALVFIDPYSETMAAMGAQRGPLGQMQPPTGYKSNLDPLLENWGLTMDPGYVVADLELAQRVDMGGGNIVDYVPWLGLRDAHMADDDIVTGELSNIIIGAAGALEMVEGKEDGIMPLLQSSKTSGLMPMDELLDQPDPDRMIRELLPTDKVYTLAARIRRQVETAYPDGPPVTDDGAEEEEGPTGEAQDPLPDHVAQSDGPVNIIVVSDVDIMEDRFWAQVQNYFGSRVAVPVADNGRFIINAVDQLSGSDALISLRSRGVYARPFEVVDRLRRQAESKHLIEQERLTNELMATEERLSVLESSAENEEAMLSEEQLAEIERFRAKAVETRQALRDVQRDLREDIESLEQWVTALNIAAVPAVLIVISLFVGWRRRQGRRARA